MVVFLIAPLPIYLRLQYFFLFLKYTEHSPFAVSGSSVIWSHFSCSLFLVVLFMSWCLPFWGNLVIFLLWVDVFLEVIFMCIKANKKRGNFLKTSMDFPVPCAKDANSLGVFVLNCWFEVFWRLRKSQMGNDSFKCYMSQLFILTHISVCLIWCSVALPFFVIAVLIRLF